MPRNESTGTRILAAHAQHCANITAEWEAARAAGAPTVQLAELEAQVIAARRMYQELAVDLPAKTNRPWWRFFSNLGPK
ncbi:MAG: hypothetical protein WCG26_02495 [Chloroflexales bacterium]